MQPRLSGDDNMNKDGMHGAIVCQTSQLCSTNIIDAQYEL